MVDEYKGKQIQQTIVVTDLLNGRTVTTMQQAYLLTEADFLRLKGSPPVTAAIATIIFSGVIGYIVSLGPKIAPIFNGGASELTSGEINTILVGITISIALYAVGFFCPNDKKKLMNKISKHFDDAKPSSHIVGEQK
ncbi:TPA: hypothetical protein ACSP0C_002251 [Aeromonas veronii]